MDRDDFDDLKGHDRGVDVVDPHSVVDDKTISRWTQDWLRWSYFAPNNADQNPLLDTTGQAANFNNNGKIFFIAGTFGTGEATREISDVPADKPILLPMINAWDTEGPGIETLANFHGGFKTESERFSAEATLVTELAKASIYDAYATLTRIGDSKPLVDLHWPDSARFSESTGIFSWGAPPSGSFFADGLLGGSALDPTIADLPFTKQIGYWLMLDELKPGDYTLEFGGHGHAVQDPTDATRTVFSEGWGSVIHDTLHVV